MDAATQANILNNLENEPEDDEEPTPKRHKIKTTTNITQPQDNRKFLISQLTSILSRNPNIELDLTESDVYKLKQLTTDQLENALENMRRKIGQTKPPHQTALSVLGTAGTILQSFGGQRYGGVAENLVNDDALVAAIDILLPAILDDFTPQMVALDRLAYHLTQNKRSSPQPIFQPLPIPKPQEEPPLKENDPKCKPTIATPISNTGSGTLPNG